MRIFWYKNNPLCNSKRSTIYVTPLHITCNIHPGVAEGWGQWGWRPHHQIWQKIEPNPPSKRQKMQCFQMPSKSTVQQHINVKYVCVFSCMFPPSLKCFRHPCTHLYAHKRVLLVFVEIFAHAIELNSIFEYILVHT